MSSRAWRELIDSCAFWSRRRTLDIRMTNIPTSIMKYCVNVCEISLHCNDANKLLDLPQPKRMKTIHISGKFMDEICWVDLITIFSAFECIEELLLFVQNISEVNMIRLVSVLKTLLVLYVKGSLEFRVTPEQFYEILTRCPKLKKINMPCADTPVEWSEITNMYCGKICFGHDMMDVVPRQLLRYDRWLY